MSLSLCVVKMKRFKTYLKKLRGAIELHVKSKREAHSLVSQVLMANNKLNPAQKASLQKAKELLHG